ncbi:glycosyltransferase [Planococcus chinensis]|uniref:Glycosyltransferase n=1 Tax=Planococcus chinensis TaxID=272917 RepID=A0ABW4QEK1_9BACL
MQSKNITFLIESLDGGGAERVTSILANEFSNKGFNVKMIILSEAEKEYYVNPNVKKYYLTLKKSSNKYKKLADNFMEIYPLIKRLKSDVIISLAMPVTNIHLLPILLFSKKKVILSERSNPEKLPRQYLLKKVRNMQLRLADSIVFQTTDAKEYFSPAIQKKGRLIPNPISNELPMPHVGRRKKEIVNFCRLDAGKNLPMLIDAFMMFVEEFPDYKLSIYGRGCLEQELKEYAKAKQSKENQITFHGHKDDLHETIKSNAIYVSSSNYEGISNSMLEAMAIGLPTICTDCPVGGARMIIKPYENGMLIPVNDTIALYKAMKELALDESLSHKLSKNAFQIREELSVEKIFNYWKGIVEGRGEGFSVDSRQMEQYHSEHLQ